LSDPDWRDIWLYYLMTEIQRRRLQIKLKEVLVLRRAILDSSAETPDTKLAKEFLYSLFPYLKKYEEEEQKRIKELAKESREELILVSPVRSRKR